MANELIYNYLLNCILKIMGEKTIYFINSWNQINCIEGIQNMLLTTGKCGRKQLSFFQNYQVGNTK